MEIDGLKECFIFMETPIADETQKIKKDKTKKNMKRKRLSNND